WKNTWLYFVARRFKQIDKYYRDKSLNECRRAGECRFIGCAQLLLAWFHSHFWEVDKVSYWVFSENYSPLKEIVAIPRRDDISEEK
ncbi:hypothetical protein Goarm_005752, partial [Gossypium armourianum]|nr:hypothetical protein [Gossypium armourianum]